MSLKTTLVCLFAALPIAAQLQNNQTPTLNCNQSRNNGQITHCEIREQTIPASGKLVIDGQKNGGITVQGSTRKDVFIRARVQTYADSEAEAQSRASQISVQTAGDQVRADGPDGAWSVSYEVFVPQQYELLLTTNNGGIHISDVHGGIEFQAVNGGVHLSRLAGNVHGETQNGGVHIALAGSTWVGHGLDVKTTNGGVHLTVPANYSAHLETATVNGGVHSSGIPDLAISPRQRQISADLGSGGPTLRIVTTNGGVHLNRS